MLEGSATGAGLALVRPESVSLVPDPGGEARVVGISFLGPVSRATAVLGDGTEVLAQLTGSAGHRLRVGDRVRVEVDATPVLVVGA